MAGLLLVVEEALGQEVGGCCSGYGDQRAEGVKTFALPPEACNIDADRHYGVLEKSRSPIVYLQDLVAVNSFLM